MAVYRLRHRYHLKRDRVFEAADDADAIRKGRRLAGDSDYALRCGDRCVALLHQDRPPLLVAGRLDRLHRA
ncbi:MAG: hypothetical protein ABW128_03150 [Rhizorhabdus sp.]